MLGTEGIAVGLSSRILPHNFPELLEAQIAILKKQPFKCLPDFPTGGLMDARGYKDGTGERQGPRQDQGQGRVHRRHQGDPAHDHHRFADRLHRGRRAQGQDQGQEHQRFHLRGGRDRGQGAAAASSAEQLVDALYAFTDCEVTIASRIVVIRNNRPVELTVSRGAAGEHGPTGGDAQAGARAQGDASSRTNCISARWSASSSRSASTRRSSSARPTKPSWPRCTRASSRSAGSWCAS